jgi:hypothetical protein
LIAKLEKFYNESRYLDAYALCRPVFEDSEKTADLTSRELLLLGRLAGRLGGDRIFESMFQKARERFPDDPLVRYYAGPSKKASQHHLFRLRQIASFRVNDLETDSDKAVWHATAAWYYARIRDFDRAHALIDKSRSYQKDKACTMICEA